ncbi:MAG: GtrA family protein [Bacteroidales bacterium]|nr:GtrA family protein [Bacteroidales bacterium]
MSIKAFLTNLFTGQSSDVKIQLLRYGVSGLTAAAVDMGVLALLTEVFGERLLLVWTAIAFACGLLVTYLMSIHWVFSNRSVHNQATELAIFIVIGLIGLALTELLMWVFARKLEWHYLIAKMASATTVFIWNFTAKKLLLFRNK